MKRSAMTRKTPMPRGKAMIRSSEPARQAVNPSKCAACRAEFFRLRPKQKACKPECAQQLAQAQRLKDERRQDKAKLADLKPLSHWLDLTQKTVNAYVRTRDAHLPCVSCGTMNASGWDAGHFFSRGARPNLRFEPLNIHKQCQKCNRFASADVQAAYRQEIERRIGSDMLQQLGGDHEPRKSTRAQLEEIRAHYRAKLRELRSHEA